jgi:hypothetical protein
VLQVDTLLNALHGGDLRPPYTLNSIRVLQVNKLFYALPRGDVTHLRFLKQQFEVLQVDKLFSALQR